MIPSNSHTIGHGRRVLLVEDDNLLRASLTEFLTESGYVLDDVATLAQAVQKLDYAQYDVVVSDYHLPDGHGLTLAEQLKDASNSALFILMTACDERGLNARAIGAGAVDYLSKPFTIDQLERAIEHGLLRAERQRQQQLDLTNEVLTGAISALIAAVDAKDPYTADHSQRVRGISSLLGSAIGLNDQERRALEFAALVHDVGKIGVPGAILRKEGPLTDEEWDILKTHPVRGAEIIAQAPQLQGVALAVRHHHERYAGGGYPDSLKGPQIPEFARVITLADAFEAMTSDRAYRRGFSRSAARDRIAESTGSQFDPFIAEVFLSFSLSALP